MLTRNQIHLLPEFKANRNCLVRIYCSPDLFADCTDYSQYLMEYRTGNVSQNENSYLKTIELTFTKSTVEHVLISPNPNNGYFNLEIGGRDGAIIKTIEIFNFMGEKILFQIVNSRFEKFNLSDQPAGLYFLKAEDDLQTFVKSIIIQ